MYTHIIHMLENTSGRPPRCGGRGRMGRRSSPVGGTLWLLMHSNNNNNNDNDNSNSNIHIYIYIHINMNT